ncbi:hypothetical protein N0V93_000056 [Gnomoniopsis smithogilvyi]|uniref:Bacteriophage T5 Orf172 DNA-binding domain-containing protein n=1 Tax=Gnomoniopsis smithogilvyi TaxID=1191159 RepID=A0A9W8YZ35_9PEZI|nr:hypothetical protein N0V93_000056 [Gnomoniopsis smithogilvyi]
MPPTAHGTSTGLIETDDPHLCGVNGWHQPESEDIFREWCRKLWHIYLRTHGLDPDLCISSPDELNRDLWFAGLETAKSEQDAQLALLAGSSESDSESGEDEDDSDYVYSSDGNSDDDGSDDGDSDDGDSDDSQEELVILTPSSSASNLSHGDDLASSPPSSPVDYISFREEHAGTRSAKTKKNSRPPTSPGRSSPVAHSSHQVVESVVAVTQRNSTLQKSSTRLQVYHDPLPPSALPAQKRPQKARESASTARSTTACPPSDTRRRLGELDRNIDVSSQSKAQEPESGPSRTRDAGERSSTHSEKQSASSATYNKTSGSNQRARRNKTETARKSDIEVEDSLIRRESTTENRNRRPCSRCRGNGYRVLESGPLATEEDMMQLLSQFDVTEVDEPASNDSSSSPISKGFRMYPQLSPKENMKSIFNTIIQHSGPRNRAPGYIYAFTRPSRPGFIKIGYTNAIEQPDRPYPHPVDFRLARWASDCGHPVTEVFREYMPCAAERIESLIHQTLREYRRIEDPVCRPCQRRRGGRGGAHDEWFEIGVEEARQVVRSWALFSGQRPYDSFGAPVEFWAQKAEQEREAKNSLGLRKWLDRIAELVEEVRRLEFKAIVGFVGGLRF